MGLLRLSNASLDCDWLLRICHDGLLVKSRLKLLRPKKVELGFRGTACTSHITQRRVGRRQGETEARVLTDGGPVRGHGGIASLTSEVCWCECVVARRGRLLLLVDLGRRSYYGTP